MSLPEKPSELRGFARAVFGGSSIRTRRQEGPGPAGKKYLQETGQRGRPRSSVERGLGHWTTSGALHFRWGVGGGRRDRRAPGKLGRRPPTISEHRSWPDATGSPDPAHKPDTMTPLGRFSVARSLESGRTKQAKAVPGSVQLMTGGTAGKRASSVSRRCSKSPVVGRGGCFPHENSANGVGHGFSGRGNAA